MRQLGQLEERERFIDDAIVLGREAAAGVGKATESDQFSHRQA